MASAVVLEIGEEEARAVKETGGSAAALGLATPYENGHVARSAHMFGCGCKLCDAATRLLVEQVRRLELEAFELVFSVGNMCPCDLDVRNRVLMTALPIVHFTRGLTLKDLFMRTAVPPFSRSALALAASDPDLAGSVFLGVAKGENEKQLVRLEIRERFFTKVLSVRESTRPGLLQTQCSAVYLFSLGQTNETGTRRLFRGLTSCDLEERWRTVRPSAICGILRELGKMSLFEFQDGDITYANNARLARLCFVRNSAGELVSRLCIRGDLLEVSLVLSEGCSVLVNGLIPSHREALEAGIDLLSECMGLLRTSKIPVSFACWDTKGAPVMSALFVRFVRDE
jgi:hypothetical protein